MLRALVKDKKITSGAKRVFCAVVHSLMRMLIDMILLFDPSKRKVTEHDVKNASQVYSLCCDPFDVEHWTPDTYLPNAAIRRFFLKHGLCLCPRLFAYINAVIENVTILIAKRILSFCQSSYITQQDMEFAASLFVNLCPYYNHQTSSSQRKDANFILRSANGRFVSKTSVQN